MPNMNDFFQLPGLEAIDYQVNSKLAKGLIDIFQEVIDFAAEDYSPESSNLRGKNRADRVLNYCKRNVESKLIKLVEKETGLLFTKIHWEGGVDKPLVTGLFAVDVTMDSATDSIETIARETGTTKTPVGQFLFIADDESYNEMRGMTKKLDLHTGKLNGRRYGQDNRRVIQAELYFDVNSAFCLSEFVPDGIVEDNGLTAGEIAAVVCHEIGHAISLVEHAGDMYRVSSRCRSAINIKSMPSPDDLAKTGKDGMLKALARGHDLLDDLKKRAAEELDPEALKPVINRINAVQQAGDNISKGIKTHEDNESSWWVVGSLALFVIQIVYRVWIVSMIVIWFHVLGLICGKSIMKLCQSERTQAEKTKAGDTRITKNDQFLFERWADEYAARHGLGVPLATGLNKIGTIMTYADYTWHIPVFSNNLLRSTVFAFLCKTYHRIFGFFDLAQAFDPYIYEFSAKRIKRIRENVYDFFKSSQNVSPDVKRMWINSVDELSKAEKEARIWQTSDFTVWALRNIGKFVGPIEWATFIKNGRLSDDFMFLQNAIDAMRHNPMYYFAEKFDLKRYEKK